MANVDLCVRLCQKGICSDQEFYSNEIAKLCDSLRVNILKGKSAAQIQKLLILWSNYITTTIKDIYYKSNEIEIIIFPSSDNNKIAADIFHILPNQKRIDIELKFGAATDKNVGMNNFEKIFVTSCFKTGLGDEIRKKMLNEFIKENYNEENQSIRLMKILNNIIENFNTKISSLKFQLDKSSQMELEDLVFENSGELNSSSKDFLKFKLKGEDLEIVKPLIKGEGIWEIEKVNFLKKQKDRVNVKLYNNQAKLKMRFTLNWKNSFKYKGLKFKASLGFGSPSWNIWISKI